LYYDISRELNSDEFGLGKLIVEALLWSYVLRKDLDEKNAKIIWNIHRKSLSININWFRSKNFLETVIGIVKEEIIILNFARKTKENAALIIGKSWAGLL